MMPASFRVLLPTAMRHLTRSLLILPLVIVTAAAFAADKPAKKEGGFGDKASGAYLTKEQLRSCIAQRDKVKADDDELLAEQAAIGAQKDQIARVGDTLKSQLETVDRTNAEAIAAYNEAVQGRDKQIDTYQARVTAFNGRVDVNQAAHATFGQACSNRRYFEEDEAAIKKGK
jgi:hypothetical protein